MLTSLRKYDTSRCTRLIIVALLRVIVAFLRVNPNDCLFMKALSNKGSFSPAVESNPAIRAEIGCSAAWTGNGTM